MIYPTLHVPNFGMDRFTPPKPLEQWQTHEVIDWIFQWAESKEIDKEEINTLAFNVSGQELATLSREDFASLDQLCGADIYDELQNLKYIYHSDQEITSSTTTVIDKDALNDGYLPLNGRIVASPAAPVVPPGMKKILPNSTSRRGRPCKSDTKSRNRQGKGSGKLWEFIRDLLLNPATNPSLIRWERKEEGIFRFVQSGKVAKMWGDRKQNPKMTYEKLSRAMRTYYDKNIIVPVPKIEGLPKKLVYKFGDNTPRWW